MATPCDLASSTNSGERKLSWRTSTAWRRVRPSSECGSSPRKAAKSSGSETFVGRDWRVDRPQLVAELQRAAREEALDRRARPGERPAIGCVARGLHGEDETLRRLVAPACEALRLLRAVVRAVDLDGAEALRGVLQLAPLREARRIEAAAPGRVVPSADADANPSGRRPSPAHCCGRKRYQRV